MCQNRSKKAQRMHKARAVARKARPKDAVLPPEPCGQESGGIGRALGDNSVKARKALNFALERSANPLR